MFWTVIKLKNNNALKRTVIQGLSTYIGMIVANLIFYFFKDVEFSSLYLYIFVSPCLIFILMIPIYFKNKNQK
jgi:uncharacterized membrane protein YgaE (UPF0421/DUF939 family)